jgi:hypothetical protein
VCRLTVPFQLVPGMVSKRDVVVTSGRAGISCRRLKQFLASVFESILRHSMLETGRLADRRDDGEDDQRLDLLLGQIRHAFRSTVMKRRGAASRSNVAPLRCRFYLRISVLAEKFSRKMFML